MAKKIRIVLTLQLPAGKATPAPPVGTALGPHGINIVEFTKSYNEKTADKAGQIIPAQITVFEDRSFSFILKTPPAADLLRKAAGVEKGSMTPKREGVGRVTRPTPSRLGFIEPFSTPAALRSKSAAGGVLRMNVNERSSKIVSWAGMIWPVLSCVRAL